MTWVNLMVRFREDIINGLGKLAGELRYHGSFANSAHSREELSYDIQLSWYLFLIKSTLNFARQSLNCF